MNSDTPNIDYQALDGGDWWLRDSTYSEPKWRLHSELLARGANVNNVHSITFNDANCGFSTVRYICSVNVNSQTNFGSFGSDVNNVLGVLKV